MPPTASRALDRRNSQKPSLSSPTFSPSDRDARMVEKTLTAVRIEFTAAKITVAANAEER